jgi:hypothetical protein
MEPAPIIEAGPREESQRHSPIHSAVRRNIATFIVAFVTAVVSAVVILSWFKIGPDIPYVTRLFDMLFHMFGY